MTPEKDAALCSKYPKIFSRNGVPCEQFHFECNDGWFDLIDTLCKQIQSHCDFLFKRQEFEIKSGRLRPDEVWSEEDFQVTAAQVKEKFGGLRFYVSGGDDVVQGMLRMAEAISFKVCEDCGDAGKTSGPGWIRTLCTTCRKSREVRRFE